jgi:hypothetical protein
MIIYYASVRNWPSTILPPPLPPPLSGPAPHLSLTVLMYSTLLPRMNASPYLFFSCPFTYSCACINRERGWREVERCKSEHKKTENLLVFRVTFWCFPP